MIFLFFPGLIDTRFDLKGKVYLATGTTGYFDGSVKAAFSVQALEIVNGAVIEELPQANVWALSNDIITNGKESCRRKFQSWTHNLTTLDGTQAVYGVTAAGTAIPASLPGTQNSKFLLI